MLQHFLLFLWLSNRLPPCPALGRGWEKHGGPGGRKRESWERDRENWEGKEGVETGQSGCRSCTGAAAMWHTPSEHSGAKSSN